MTARNGASGSGLRYCALALLLAGCGGPSQPYARLHDAALTTTGDAVLMLVESGQSEVRGSLFSGNEIHTPRRLALWRLARRTGALTLVRELALPKGFEPFHGQPRLADFAGGEPLQASLPDCRVVLGGCAIARTPAPYVAADLTGGRLRGLQLIDAGAGKRVFASGSGLAASDWPHRTSAAVGAARDAALRRSVQVLFDAARVRRAAMESAPDRGAGERGTTFVDSVVGASLEGLMAEYRVGTDGAITARLAYGDDAPFNLRWVPVLAGETTSARAAGVADRFRCESNRPDADRWAPGCRFVVAAVTLDPEIAYLESQRARLEAEARADVAYQSARRGTTFGRRFVDTDTGLSWVGCTGVPGTRVGGCDPERGDSVCSLRLPVLCVGPEATTQAAALPGDDPRWLDARIAASQPVRGDELATTGDASARCAAEFGPGWRIASWRDRGDGFVARGAMRGDSRAWIDVPGRPAANCWNSLR